MAHKRDLNWAPRGEKEGFDNDGDLARGDQHNLRRLAERTGAKLDVVLGDSEPGSARNWYLSLPSLEGRGLLTTLRLEVLTKDALRAWARENFHWSINIKANPSDVQTETTHLVLISDRSDGDGQLFTDLEHLPELPSLEQITFVPPFDPEKPLEVPDWIKEFTFVESIQADLENCTWTLITTQSFPESTTRTIRRARVECGVEYWTPPGFSRNLNKHSQASEDNWSWSDFSDVADYFVDVRVNHSSDLDRGYFPNVSGPLPSVAAYVEYLVNDRAFGMFGEPISREDLFIAASFSCRPLMILSRYLTPLALRCAKTGESPELKTMFGVGEFLYPKVLASVEKRLAAEKLAGSHSVF